MPALKSDPFFIIEISGMIINSQDDPNVIEFEFSEGDDEGKYMKFTMEDFDMSFMDDPRIVEGRKVSWRYGYMNYLSPKFTGKIGEIECSFSAGSGTTITIHVFDAIMDTLNKVRSKKWFDKPEGIYFHEVVQKIAAEHGLAAVVEPSKTPRGAFIQSNESDWDFIQRVTDLGETPLNAAKRGIYRLTLSADNTKLFWKPVANAGPHVKTYVFYTETNNPELVSFQPRSKPYDPATRAKDGAMNKEQGPNDEDEGTEATNETETGRTSSDKGSTVSLNDAKQLSGQVTGAVLTNPVADETRSQGVDNSQTAASNAHDKAEIDALEADATVLLEPRLRRGDTIMIRGVAKKFAGKWLVNKVRATINQGGALMELELIKNTIEDTALGAKPTAGRPSGDANPEKSDPVMIEHDLTLSE